MAPTKGWQRSLAARTHWTTNLKFSACVVDPELAFTAIVYVPAGVPPDPPPLEDPASHPTPTTAINSAAAHSSRTAARLPRETTHIHASTAPVTNSHTQPGPLAGKPPRGPNTVWPTGEQMPLVATLTVMVTAELPLRFAEAELTARFAPEGAPEHGSDTLPENPAADPSDKL